MQHPSQCTCTLTHAHMYTHTHTRQTHTRSRVGPLSACPSTCTVLSPDKIKKSTLPTNLGRINTFSGKTKQPQLQPEFQLQTNWTQTAVSRKTVEMVLQKMMHWPYSPFSPPFFFLPSALVLYTSRIRKSWRSCFLLLHAPTPLY